MRDGFDALFHPEGKATLTRGVMRAASALLGPLAERREATAMVGPLALLAVIASWGLLLLIGWALIFWPHLDGGFHSLQQGEDSFFDALYVSMVTLSTLGFGDITPTETWLRILTPLEALLGFGLLTASISWLLTLYPAVNRRRALAYEITLLHETEADSGVDVTALDARAAEHVLADLTSRLVSVERDLVAFPVTYYFREADERFSLAAATPYVLDLVERASRDGVPEGVRFRAAMLRQAVDDFAVTVGKRFP